MTTSFSIAKFNKDAPLESLAQELLYIARGSQLFVWGLIFFEVFSGLRLALFSIIPFFIFFPLAIAFLQRLSVWIIKSKADTLAFASKSAAHLQPEIDRLPDWPLLRDFVLITSVWCSLSLEKVIKRSVGMIFFLSLIALPVLGPPGMVLVLLQSFFSIVARMVKEASEAIKSQTPYNAAVEKAKSVLAPQKSTSQPSSRGSAVNATAKDVKSTAQKTPVIDSKQAGVVQRSGSSDNFIIWKRNK